jgi:cytosine/adenosine deaminase-related metal-dependent hydrolase
MTARDALELATLGGATVLGRDDIGSLAPGMSADFICIDVDKPSLAGAQQDVIAALVLCQVDSVDFSFIHGQRVVDGGRITTVDVPVLVERLNQLSGALFA